VKCARPAKQQDGSQEELRQRLARAIAATEEALELSPERARAVMEERARALARVPASTPRDSDVLQLVVFTLADERYGVETRFVREVVRLTDYTPIPGAPGFLLGVMNLRGEILAVIDLRKFLGLGQRGVTDLSRVLVLGGERAEFGVLADTADEVLALPADQAHEPPGTVAGIGREYLRGVTSAALLVLDGGVLLQDARLFIDQADDRGA
jgi:purine-binding chemotaxis protein CheW